jgi:SpoVK/Ycf46/Vps4 family AAA+-type ATPase
MEQISKVVPAAGRDFSNLARKIQTRWRWSDLVVPVSVREQLRQIVDEIVNGSALASEWRVSRPQEGPGVQVLFHGGPGTGKVLAANVLASELDFDLYGIDYGAVISPQPTDTAKNLERLLEAAAKHTAVRTPEQRRAIEEARRDGLKEPEDNKGLILVFEDSETLFGGASSNPNSSNLLGLIKLRGNLIFTTTSVSELDKKLLSVFSHVVEFPFPDAETRAVIWRLTIPPDLPIETDIDYETLGRNFTLSGEQIRNAVFAAATVAKREGTMVAMRHLESAAAQHHTSFDN